MPRSLSRPFGILRVYVNSDRCGLTRLIDNSSTVIGVVLSTLHGSKGLEFDCVWIIGAEDSNLPHPNSTEEDERRLFYVGMTRAKDRLEISSSLEDGLESRFVKEAELL